jgi:hypothetical protein
VNVKIARDGVEIGECDWDDLEQLLNEEQVLPTDHYWYEGMPDWRLLADLISLAESEPAAPQSPSDWETGEFAVPPPRPVDWDSGEPATSPPAFPRPSIATVAIGCAVAAAVAIVLYLLVVFSDRRPDTPLPASAPTPDLDRTDTALRARAKNQLIARLDKLPVVASPPSYTFYNDLSLAIPKPPASLTARIRGWENVVDPVTKQITSHTNFVVTADFRQERWFFKYYHASVNDLAHGTTTDTEIDDRDIVPPAIVSLLGLQVKSD